MFAEITLIDYQRPLAARAAARKSAGPYRWRPTPTGKGRGFYCAQTGGGLVMDRAGSSLELRLEEANAHLGHTRLAFTDGYFCDLDGGDTLQPIIARLPKDRGFLPGWTMGAGMCGSLGSHAYSEAADAAYAAHQMAESDADASREAAEAEPDEGEDD